ncbi:Large exoprotein containing haemagglutination activity domain [Beggiatoa sp. PS]|nr:Large exoprotein containing haemagglutination activity domain [Beggiatoa sp. PS]
MISFFRQSIIFITQLGLMMAISAQAQISTDGTLGPAQNLPGPDYQIGPDLGQTLGNNLFHSFQDFNLRFSESATFSGPNHIQNVISRVTGGNPSQIDGLIRSTIPNADFYFLNPYGIMFGPNASLDVQGSFHASTADYLRLGENERFYSDLGNESVLSVAPPVAFGFLDNNATDGSLGPEQNLSGPDYQIGANLGQQRGSNLFHSFQDFNLSYSESATFYGPDNVQNIISRVTGGNPSRLNGLIRSTIPNVNIYFLNPYGGLIGPNATLDMSGSFYVGIVHYVHFSDNALFYTFLGFGKESVLSAALPESFGFLSLQDLIDLPEPEPVQPSFNISSFFYIPSLLDSRLDQKMLSLPLDFLDLKEGQLLANRCAGLTRDDLSSFSVSSGPQTRPSAPDDFKTHAIQITDILPLTVYQTGASQQGANFDNHRQLPPLRIGCARH